MYNYGGNGNIAVGEIMKEYILSIAAAAVISALMNIITPKQWNKYVGIVTGLMVVVCIARPILGIMNADFFEEIQYSSNKNSVYGNRQLYLEVGKKLAERVTEDVEKRMLEEFGVQCSAEVTIQTNDGGQIEGIDSITVYGKNIDNIAVGRLREVYGAKEVQYDEHKKNTQKQE